MLPPEIHLFGRTRSKPGQGSVLDGLALASDFGFCFQCQAGSRLVLHRPSEITAETGQVKNGRPRVHGSIASNSLDRYQAAAYSWAPSFFSQDGAMQDSYAISWKQLFLWALIESDKE